MPGREEEGRKILERLAELSVSQAPLDLVGWCHFRLGRYEAAEQWLRTSMREDSEKADSTSFDLALVLLAKEIKNTEEAEEAYAEAKMRAAGNDVRRQRGLFHVAAIDVKVAIEDGVIDREKGDERLKDLKTRLEEANNKFAKLKEEKEKSANQSAMEGRAIATARGDFI
jgi:hypothetical protein